MWDAGCRSQSPIRPSPSPPLQRLISGVTNHSILQRAFGLLANLSDAAYVLRLRLMENFRYKAETREIVTASTVQVEQCYACQGQGHVNCSNCNGHGTVWCNQCSGSGQVTETTTWSNVRSAVCAYYIALCVFVVFFFFLIGFVVRWPVRLSRYKSSVRGLSSLGLRRV